MIFDACAAVARDHSGDIAVETTTGDSITYADLMRRAERFAGNLRGLGVQPGQVVATQLPNSIDYAALILGLARVGAVHVPVSMKATPEQAAWLLERTRPALMVQATPGPAKGTTPAVLGELADRDAPRLPDIPADLAAGVFRLLQTSGSTGQPRLVIWRQDAFVTERTRWVAHTGITSDDVLFCRHTLDVAHGSDIHLFPALLTGARLVLADPDASPETLLDDIVRHGATMCSALPRHYEQYIRAVREGRAARPDRPRLPLCGGAFLSPDTVRDADEVLGIHIRRVYGSTEFGMALGNMQDVVQIDRGMPPVQGVEARIVPLTSEYPDTGELVLRSPCTSAGYLGDDEANARAFREGWYWTGDASKRDAVGEYRILGRTQDMLLTDAGPVFAPQVEAEIAASCPVVEVVVLAADPDHPESALVVARPADGHDGGEVKDAIAKLTDSRRLGATIVITGEIPHIPVGKPDKPLIRKTWAAA